MSLIKIIKESISGISIDDISFGKKQYEIGNNFKIPVKIKGYEKLTPMISLIVEYNKQTDFPQLHIELDRSIQRKGIGTKIYKAYIKNNGYITTSRFKQVTKGGQMIWQKLEEDSSIEIYKGSDSIMKLAIDKNYNNKEQVIKKFNQYFK